MSQNALSGLDTALWNMTLRLLICLNWS